MSSNLIDAAPEGDIAVVGFDGAARAVCGWAAPLVRRRMTEDACVTEEYFLLPVADIAKTGKRAELVSDVQNYTPRDSATEAQVALDYKYRRKTRLPEPFHSVQPGRLILYVKRELLEAADLPLPTEWEVDVEHLQKLTDDCFLLYIRYERVHHRMRQMVEALQEKAVRLLVRYNVIQKSLGKLDDREDAGRRKQNEAECSEIVQKVERIAEMALVADYTHQFRSQIRMNQALAFLYSSNPGRLDQLWEMFVHREIGIFQKEFRESVVTYNETIAAKALVSGAPAPLQPIRYDDKLPALSHSKVGETSHTKSASASFPFCTPKRQALPKNRAISILMENIREKPSALQLPISSKVAASLPPDLKRFIQVSSGETKVYAVDVVQMYSQRNDLRSSKRKVRDALENIF